MTDKVPVVPPLSKEKIESFTVALLMENQPEVFKGKLPVDIDAIYELYIPKRFGIETGYTDLSSLGSNVLGYTDASNKKSFVDKSLVDTSDITALRRGRATIGHESGHCLFHVNILNIFQSVLADDGITLRRADRSKLKPYVDPEWQGWEFARACLMPRALVIQCINNRYSVGDMADLFDVNPAFMEVRLKRLGYQTIGKGRDAHVCL